jgi:hypothetical protein
MGYCLISLSTGTILPLQRGERGWLYLNSVDNEDLRESLNIPTYIE